jgi:hypothetical protein
MIVLGLKGACFLLSVGFFTKYKVNYASTTNGFQNKKGSPATTRDFWFAYFFNAVRV